MTQPASPRITIFSDPQAMASTVADQIAERLCANPRLVLGLPTGRTPIQLYERLVRLAAEGRVDFSHATTFNLDEFLAVPADHPGSFRTFMNTHLFSHVNLAPHRIHFLDGVAARADEECARYEQSIAKAGGIDLQLLGVGTNGHIGFNEPAAALQPWTHQVALTMETRRANAELFGGDPSQVPSEALTMGMATILHARSIVLLASGAAKAPVVERILHGPITTELPASFLQLHPDVEIVLDEPAAAEVIASRGRA
jgi:glucosamine-6-phosphate deaminase